MATIKYNGMELEEITEPQIFDPPKKMLVWGNCIEEPQEGLVVAVLPENCKKENRIIGIGLFSFSHCAEIPEAPKPRRATNRELANWLAMGNGEIFLEGTNFAVSTQHIYSRGTEDEPCGEDYVVRKWEDTEWHEPDVEYMNIETNTTAQ